jgi:hypothetical protein
MSEQSKINPLEVDLLEQYDEFDAFLEAEERAEWEFCDRSNLFDETS